MHKLELKTKSEDTSNNTLNLTHYSCFAKDKFLRTYNKIKDNLIDIKEDGTFRLDQKYFNYTTGLTMTSNAFHNLFGQKPRNSKNY